MVRMSGVLSRKIICLRYKKAGASEGDFMNKKKLLKKIVSENGVQILSDSVRLKEIILQKDKGAVVYASQLELFLNASHLGLWMKNQKVEMLESCGKAGYESIIYKVVDETGIKYEIVKSLCEDILFAVGLINGDLSMLRLPQIEKLKMIKKNGSVIEVLDNEAREKDAYQCAKIWMGEDSAIEITNTRITLRKTKSNSAVNAFRYLWRASEDGYEQANGLIGLFYYYGVGVEADSEMALKYLMKKGGLKGEYNVKKKEIVHLLLNNRSEDKKQKISILGFSILIFLSLIISGASAVWVLLSVVNILMSAYFLFVKEGKILYRNLTTGISLILWLGFILQICLQ